MRRTVIAAAAIACPLALTACSSSPAKPASAANPSAAPSVSVAASAGQGAGNEGLSNAQVTARYKSALATITAVHLKGSTSQGGQTVTLDIQINKDNTSEGSISTAGVTVPFIHAGKLGYIQYTRGLEIDAKIDPGTQVGRFILDKWAPSNTTLGSVYNQDLASFTTYSDVAQIAEPSGDTYTYLGTAAIDGQQVAQYKDVPAATGDPVVTVSFPARGAMLPLEVSAGESGELSFVWNQPTTITAPPAADVITTP
jgi:hypothetical protein